MISDCRNTLLTQDMTIEARAKHQVLIARWQIYKN